MKKAIPIIFLLLSSLSIFAKDKVTISFYGDRIKETELGGGCISIECKPSSNICYVKVLDCPGGGGSTKCDSVILSELIIDSNVIVVNRELVSHEIVTTEYQTQTHKLYLK